MNTFKKVAIYRKELTPEGMKWDIKVYDTLCVYFKHFAKDFVTNSYRSGDTSVRIQTNESICRVGDMIVFGEDAPDVPPDMAYVITEVTENFKGSKHMQHVKIRAR